MTDRADKDGGFETFDAVAGLQGGNPAPVGLVPLRRRQFGVETDVAAHVVFERDRLQIIEEFLALREVTGPLVSRAERE